MTNKLLVVTTVPITVRSFLLPFIQHFRSLGWRVDGMAQGISADLACVEACDRVFDIQWSRNVLDPRNFFVGVKRVQEVVAAEDYDLVHVHTPIAAFVTRYALKNFPKTKVIYTAHGFHFYQGGSWLKNTIFYNLEKLAGAWTDYLITINPEDKSAAIENNFLPVNKIYYTRGIGVDTGYYAVGQGTETAVEQIQQELNLAATDSLLLSVAEFTPRKRHRDLLNALAKLSDQTVHLALVGDGPLEKEMQELAVQLAIHKQVHFLGYRTDIPVLIQAAQAVLLVSQQEGLPRSIMEAMCLDTPVIGSNVRGTKDLLADGCGLLIKLGDTDAIAQAMAEVVNNPEKSAQMACHAKLKIADYDIQQIIKEYVNIYDLALAAT